MRLKRFVGRGRKGRKYATFAIGYDTKSVDFIPRNRGFSALYLFTIRS